MDGGDRCHVGSFRGASQLYRTISNPTSRLRFRPIAPKPIAGGSFPGRISPGKEAAISTSKRVKRKYVRVKKDDNSPTKRRNGNGSLEKNGESVTLTLRLMPERLDGGYAAESPRSGKEGTGQASEKTTVESWVTVVEHVVDTCMGSAVGLGCTDDERVMDLERDACPGFVSDASMSKVEWMNEAYRMMVAESSGARLPEVVLRLSAASKLGFCTDVPGFFTCRVRVQYCVTNNANGNNNVKKYWKIMPCDVWKLDCGGFAWRLDVNAALSLGL